MRVLIQRVKKASVSVDGKAVASTGKGMLILVGIHRDDTEDDAKLLAQKTLALRIFEDEQGKMNLDIAQAKGEILSVPQFTLYADTRKGNRPGFDLAAEPQKARDLWQKFNVMLKAGPAEVREGVFAAHMDVELTNDGPVTIGLDSRA